MKNLRLLFSLLIFVTFIKINSQTTIESIFLKLPVYDLKYKKKLLKDRKLNEPYLFYNGSEENSIEILPKNGYMSIFSDIKYADYGETYHICYWNLKNGKKLVALTSFIAGTATFPEISFFSYQNNIIEKLKNSDILPTIELDDLLNLSDFEETEANNFRILFKKHQILDVKLPIKGKNLEVTFDIDSDLNDKENELRTKFIQKIWEKKLTLKWNNGHFIK